MPEPDQTLTFLSWVREHIAGLGTGEAAGRVRGEVAVTVAGRRADGSATDSQSRAVRFLLAGPADVIGLQPGAIVRRYPAPGAIDHESDRCPYVEFADPSLPWRYTPAPKPPAGTGNLHPWLVLVVGVEGAELTYADGQVTIEAAIQLGPHALGGPTSAYRFAHVQADAQGRRTARVLCGRPLQAGTDYLAVVVAAYDAQGRPQWDGSGPVTVPAYDHWRFRTGVPAGSFEELAARLRPGAAPATTGRAPLRYPRLDSAPTLEIRGALVAATADDPPPDDPLPDAIADDMAGLRLPARDEQGRPIVTLPRYGDAWDASAPEAAAWARTLNGDPRHRGAAGLGLEVGIRFQEQLVTDALQHLGALAEARQRVRNVVMGLAASRSLWRRRVPADPVERLWLLGPALPRLTTDQGTVADLVTADDRALPRGVFSAAARRVLRPGPVRTALVRGAVSPGAVMAATNKAPAEPPSSVDGVPLETIGLREFDQARKETVRAGRVSPVALLAAAQDLAARVDPSVQAEAGQLVTALRRAAEARRPAPWGRALAVLATADAETLGGGRDRGRKVEQLRAGLAGMRGRFGEHADDADLTELIRQLGPSTAADPAVAEVQVDGVADAVAAAFDPTGPRAPAVLRVLETIEGLDPDQPLAPPERCVGLGRALWADVERAFEEWLLPGVGLVPEDAVISLETNPVFTDAFLCGVNTQLLAELRWRNIPVATGCTPLRRFWDRVDPAAASRVDDIVGIHAWPGDSPLGDLSHRPAGASGRDLVVAVRGRLFLRYPATIVYLQSAVHGSAADFDQDPAAGAGRILPGFQGRLGSDIAFFGFSGFAASAMAKHWLVFEEAPSGYRFANDSGTVASTGHEWAAAALAMPVRVLIRGDKLVPGSA